MTKAALSYIEQAEDLDLTPLIDVISILLIFFIIAGKLHSDNREQITIPPTLTASSIVANPQKQHLVLTVRAHGEQRELSIGNHWRRQFSRDGTAAFSDLRSLLDRAWDQADKRPVAGGTVQPLVSVEIRADADVPYCTVQELQQVLADTIDPMDGMRPKARAERPFTELAYTTRLPGEGR